MYAQLKYMWAAGAKDNSLDFLRQFSDNLLQRVKAEACRVVEAAGTLLFQTGRMASSAEGRLEFGTVFLFTPIWHLD